ncbi:MAG: B12-binding domain-containing radical SAM protein [Nitrospinota bacterium]
MKVLLVNPPRLNEIIGNNPSIIEEERGFNPPLGLLYVAAYLEKHSSFDISLIDAQVEKFGYPELSKEVERVGPAVVGLTAMTMTLLDVMKVVRLVKEIDQNIIVVLGGPHVHLFPEETINLEGVDYLVLGEGEEAFYDLLTNLNAPLKLEKTPGLVFKKNQKIINTGVRPAISDLDRLPFPARHLTPYKKYSSLLSKGGVTTTIFTSRGCPFLCSFCDRPHLGKKFRARSAINVVDEIETCTKMGINEFLFYDDTFTINKKRVIQICSEILKRKLSISWDIRTRINTVDEEVIKHLKLAGCQGIHYGIEAGTEKILKVLQKGIHISQAKEVFTLTKKYNIPVLAYFMIGNPEENLEDIKTTFSVMKELNPDFVHLTILTPFPGTKIYFEALQSGVIARDYWKEFSQNPTKEFTPPHWDQFFSREELQQLLKKGYKSFYLRPGYIVKRIFSITSVKEFKKKASAGLKVFTMK